jgi:FHA domain
VLITDPLPAVPLHYDEPASSGQAGWVDLNSYGVAIGRGEGIVARTGDVVMYIADQTGASALLGVIDSAAAAQSPGRALAKALASIALGPDSALIPPFGVLAPIGGGLLLMLSGHVAADIEANGVSRSLAGDRALTWVDEIVQEPIDKVVIGRDVAGLIASPYSDLRGGVVSGGGFILHLLAAAQPAMPPRAVAEKIEPEIPAAPARVVSQQIEPETRVVLGHSGEHAQPIEHRRPAAPSRGEVPAPLAQQLPARDEPVGAPTRKPAPPTAMAGPVIGALATEDNAVYPLDRPYVIGRNPLIDESVSDAVASPLFLPDDPEISRVHAYVTIDAGAVLVRDAGTPSGTFVAAPGDTSWIRVGAQATEIKPGWCLRVGQRILVYQKARSGQ